MYIQNKQEFGVGVAPVHRSLVGFSMACVSAGLSEAMLRPGSWSLGDKGTHYIKTIKNSSNHLATLINDILDAAAMAKGKLVIKQETVCCCLLAVYLLSTDCLLAGFLVLMSTCRLLTVCSLSTCCLLVVYFLFACCPPLFTCCSLANQACSCAVA